MLHACKVLGGFGITGFPSVVWNQDAIEKRSGINLIYRLIALAASTLPLTEKYMHRLC